MPGSIGEDFGMIGRKTEKLEKLSLDLEAEEYIGRVGSTLKNEHRSCLTKKKLLIMLNTTRVSLAYFDTGRVDHAEHDPC